MRPRPAAAALLAVVALGGAVAGGTPPVAATTLHSHGDPTVEEQLLLELMNRARRDPSAEAERVFRDYDDPVVRDAVNFFLRQRPGVEWTRAENRAAFRGYSPRPPFAFDGRLIAAARKHAALAKKFDSQSHDYPGEPDLRTRVEDEGYFPRGQGESNYAFAKSVLFAHAAFAIDWGQTRAPGAARPNLGHRDSLMDIDGVLPFAQVGVGAVRDPDTRNAVGPLIFTVEFAEPPDDATRWVTGVCFDDRDGDGFYDPGEGVAGVTVTSPASAFHTVSSASGGYSLPVPTGAPRTIQVTATGSMDGPSSDASAVFGTQTVEVEFGADNVKVDFTPPEDPPLPEVGSTATDAATDLIPGGRTEIVLDVPAHDPSNPLLGDVDVGVALRHADASRLRIAVVSPAGTEVVLFDRGLPVTDLAGTFGGNLTPHGDLRVLAGEPYAGTWTLRVDEDAGGAGGTILGASVHVRPAWIRPLAALRTPLTVTAVRTSDSAEPGADALRLDATLDAGAVPPADPGPVHLRLVGPGGAEIQRLRADAPDVKFAPDRRGTSRAKLSLRLAGLDLAGPLPSPLTIEVAAAGVLARATVPLTGGRYDARRGAPAGPSLVLDALRSRVAANGARTTTLRGRASGGEVAGLVEVFAGDARARVAADRFKAKGRKRTATGTGLLRQFVIDSRTGSFTIRLVGAHDPLVDATAPLALRLGPGYFADTVVVPAVAGTARTY